VPDSVAGVSHAKTEADLQSRVAVVEKGGEAKYHQKNAEVGKMFARERVQLLLDPGSFVEEGRFANSFKGGAPHEQGEGGPYGGLPADGVITGTGTVDGRRVAVIANDSTIKAGSWGPLTVEKILRQQEQAESLKIPLVYLVDSAGARITTQVDMFPGRRGAGRIFYNQVQMSGLVPQICGLFGPSAAGGAYIPAFCDILVMVEGNASMYLGSPRMAEMVVGEKTTLEELGGAKMHCSVSGVGDVLVKTEKDAIAKIRSLLAYLPTNCDMPAPIAAARAPAPAGADKDKTLEQVIPTNENQPFDMKAVIDRLVDAESWWEVKALYAKEILTGFARIDGKPVGIVANQPKHLGGILFVNSADKATKFIQICDAYGIPLLFLADVPGFMIGTKVEREGIIRSGAKMIFAVSEAKVPKISVVIRKAYGAGLYAMCGPGFEPDASLALPTAMIAVMGPSAAVNAVFFNKIQEKPEAERDAYRKALEEEYAEDVDLYKLASKAVVDDVVPASRLREILAARFAAYKSKERRDPKKRHGVMPV
jgi:acetyl-CoA carboxylase carboxyltransferase component